MPNHKSGRLELLIRRNKGRTEYPYYATELSHLLKTRVHPADILDIEETDRFFLLHQAQAVRASKEPGFAFEKTWKYEPKDLWLNKCQSLAEELRGEPVVLFAGPYEFCGGVKTDADVVLNAAVAVLEFDRDTVRLQSASSESGLFLDIFEQESDRLIELVVWGQWKALAETCS